MRARIAFPERFGSFNSFTFLAQKLPLTMCSHVKKQQEVELSILGYKKHRKEEALGASDMRRLENA